jgi:transcriptional regulator with XRE-family HTH domain
MKQTLGQRVKVLREHYRLTQGEFASKMGMKGYLGILKIEQGEIKNPRNETIENIVNTFGTTYEWLETGKGEMLPDGDVTFNDKKESKDNPWKDQLYQDLKDEIKFLRSLLLAKSGGEKSFLKRPSLATIIKRKDRKMIGDGRNSVIV